MTDSRSTRRTKKRRLMWGGFSDGTLHTWLAPWDDGTYRRVAVFTTRKDALCQYEDVRRIEIREFK